MEHKIENTIIKLLVCKRYADEMLMIYESENYVVYLPNLVKNVHENKIFSIEHEEPIELHYPEVLVMCDGDGSLSRRTYRQKWWMDQYLH